MFSNLLKSFNKAYTKPVITFSTRCITSYKETGQIEAKEEETALSIEAGLFNNSTVKYEPIKKHHVLSKSKQNFREVGNFVSGQQKYYKLKKTRPEREAESKLINDESLGLEFIKLSLNDPRLSTLLITARSKKRRDKDRLIVIEGRRLILEALTCGLKLDSVIFSQKELLAELKLNFAQAQKLYNTKIYKVPQHDLKTWSTLTTPPGVMAIFERPPLVNNVATKESSTSNPLPITVICDNIREPNNLGSIIRTCAAIPCLQVVITRGCCDPWDSKALRGGCGGHFRLPIRDDVDWKDVALMIPPEVADDCHIFVAENNLKKLQKRPSVEYSEMKTTGLHNVIIVGGETQGVSQDAYQFMETAGQRGKCVFIPLAQDIDSLNVASALTLILYELRKNILKAEKDNLLELD